MKVFAVNCPGMLSYKKLDNNAIPPVRAHNTDAGCDLAVSAAPQELTLLKVINKYSHTEGWQSVDILPGGVADFGLGYVVAIPEGYEGKIRSRSGLGARRGLIVRQGTGTIDPSYRGELRVVMINTSDNMITLKKGDRIAQLVVSQVSLDNWTEDAYLSTDTERGAGGFGSTDKVKQ